MPQFDLTEKQVDDLARFLSDNRPDSKIELPTDDSPTELAAQLIARQNCQSCHAMPSRLTHSEPSSKERTPLSAESDLDRSCIATTTGNQPAFSVFAETRQAIEAFIAAPGWLHETLSEMIAGNDLIRDHNCLACHSRGGSRWTPRRDRTSRRPTWRPEGAHRGNDPAIAKQHWRQTQQ